MIRNFKPSLLDNAPSKKPAPHQNQLIHSPREQKPTETLNINKKLVGKQPIVHLKLI